MWAAEKQDTYDPGKNIECPGEARKNFLWQTPIYYNFNMFLFFQTAKLNDFFNPHRFFAVLLFLMNGVIKENTSYILVLVFSLLHCIVFFMAMPTNFSLWDFCERKIPLDPSEDNSGLSESKIELYYLTLWVAYRCHWT